MGLRLQDVLFIFVDEGTDTGSIILQRVVDIQDDDTPEILQKRVLVEEHKALPEAINLIANGKVKINNSKVCISKY